VESLVSSCKATSSFRAFPWNGTHSIRCVLIWIALARSLRWREVIVLNGGMRSGAMPAPWGVMNGIDVAPQRGKDADRSERMEEPHIQRRLAVALNLVLSATMKPVGSNGFRDHAVLVARYIRRRPIGKPYGAFRLRKVRHFLASRSSGILVT
jgi:hypothetical protein